MIKVVKQTSKELVWKLKFDEEKTLGINKKITNGLTIPPVKKIKPPKNYIDSNFHKNFITLTDRTGEVSNIHMASSHRFRCASFIK